MAAARVAISRTLSAVRASSTTTIAAAIRHFSRSTMENNLPKKMAPKRKKPDQQVAALKETPADIIAQYEAAMAHQKAQSDKTLADTIASFEAALAEAQNALVQSEEEKVHAQARSSLVSVVTGSKFLEPFPCSMTCKGPKASNSNPPNEKATSIRSTFTALDLIALNKAHFLELERSCSRLRATIGLAPGTELYYGSEADVQHIVNLALQDATCICNEIIEKKVTELGIPTRVLLETRLESPLFSNRYDHVVAYDSISGTPVFVVETKKPWGDGAPTSRVFGQVFDQLKAMSAWGHKQPYGALTSFDSTYIVRLNNTPSEEEQLDWGLVEQIVPRLDPRRCKEPNKSPSPIQKRDFSTKSHAGSRSSTTEIPRQVNHSERFASHKMVFVFVSAIMRSLHGMAPRDIINFSKGSSLNLEALSIWEKESRRDNSYKWVQLQTTYNGPLLLSSSSSWMSEKIYLVDYLGMGATSKAYRALTYDGYDCVVKMYVKRFVDNEYLEKGEFDTIAKAAVDKEVEEYHTIYPDLKGYVGSRVLYGYHCVIHPFFEHPLKDKRNDLEGDITQCLKKFEKTKKKFCPHDQLWQHVGFFNDELYLFDLADLDESEATDTIETVTKSHYERLMSRI